MNLFIVVIVVIAIITIICFLGKKEKYSYSFGFPTWGEINNRYTSIYDAIIPNRIPYVSKNTFSTPYIPFRSPYNFNSVPYSPYNLSYNLPYNPPYNTPYNTINAMSNISDMYNNNPFMWRVPNTPYYINSVEPYLNNRCYSSSKDEDCVPGYSKIKKGNDIKTYKCCKNEFYF